MKQSSSGVASRSGPEHRVRFFQQFVGGLALGVIETFGAAYISVPYKDGFAFLVLVAFLIFRPQGIFGERVAEKA